MKRSEKKSNRAFRLGGKLVIGLAFAGLVKGTMYALHKSKA